MCLFFCLLLLDCFQFDWQRLKRPVSEISKKYLMCWDGRCALLTNYLSKQARRQAQINNNPRCEWTFVDTVLGGKGNVRREYVPGECPTLVSGSRSRGRQMIRRHDGLDLSVNQHCSQGHRCWKLTLNNLLSANHPVGHTHYAVR